MAQKSGCSRKVAVYNLLMEGWFPSKIACHLKCSHQNVFKIIKNYEREGKIYQTNKNPSFWSSTNQLQPPLIGGELLQPITSRTPILILHKFGASFGLVGSIPNVQKKRGLLTIKEPGYTVQFGRSKAVIWLKSVYGNSVREQVVNGRNSLLEIAKEVGERFHVKLAWLRWIPGNEWVLVEKEGSRVVGEGAGLKDAPKVIAGATWKFDDFTHPKHVEIQPAPGFALSRPTVVADRLEFLIESAPSITKSFEAISQYDANVRKHLEVLEAIGVKVGELGDKTIELTGVVKKLEKQVKKVKPTPLASSNPIKEKEASKEFYF